MRLRGVLTAAALVLGTVGLAPAPAAADPSHTAAASHRVAHVKRTHRVERGTVRLVSADVPDGNGGLRDVVRPVLQRDDGSWLDLHLTGRTKPSYNARVELSGVADDASMDVEAVSYPRSQGPRLQNLGTQPTTGTTSVLVILASWTQPDKVTPALAQSVVFTKGNPWWKETSYGQVGITGRVTNWVHIAPPSGDCYSYADQIMSRAKAAAASYNPGGYQRVIVYMPACSYSPGWGFIGAGSVWLSGEMDLRVSIHEQGHNYGLYHAHSYTCSAGGKRLTLGGACNQVEYGDDFDAMGGGSYVGHFSGRQKKLLGWVNNRYQAVSSSTTVTLTPYETPAGLKTVAVAAGNRTYWLEYRTAAGVDKSFPAGAQGLQVRMVQTGLGDPGPNALDLRPNDSGWDDFESVSLPPSTSWTTPEHVRLSAGTATASGLPVSIAFDAGTPTPPTAPRTPSAVAGDASATVKWTRPASDNGATITSYAIVASPGGRVTNVTTLGGSLTSGVVTGLANGTAYTFKVIARNVVGDSPASTATGAVTPTAAVPKVSLTSPATNAVLTGDTAPLTAAVSSSTVSKAAISEVEYLLDGESVASSRTSPWSAVLDLRDVETGPHTLQAAAYDVNGRSGSSAKVTVTYSPPLPSVAITAPAPDDVLTATTATVTLHAVPGSPAHPLQSVWATSEDGTYVGGAEDKGGGTWTLAWDVSQLSEGPHTLTAHALDDQDRSATSAPVSITLQHPSPVVSVTAPAGPVHGTGSVAVHVAPNASGDGGEVQSAQLVADGATPVAGLYAGDSGTEADPWVFPVDWRQLGNGTHVLTAKAVNAGGYTATSTPVTVVVANPAPTATLLSPGPSTLTGPVDLLARVAPDASFPSPVASVVFLSDGTQVAYGADNGDGTWGASWDTSFGDQGAHVLTVQVTDEDGNSGTSAGVGVTLDNPGPSVALTSPSSGATVQGDLVLTAAVTPNPVTGTAISTVEYDIDGSPYAYGDSAAPDWTATISADWLAAGSHGVVAKVYDGDGLVRSSAPVTVQLVTKPDAPDGLSAVPHTASVDLLWSAPAFTGGAPLTGYKVQRVADDFTTVLSTTPVADPAATSYTVTGLTGDSVVLQVVAVGPAGDSVPAGPFQVDLAPQSVTGLTAAGGYGRMTLHWSPSTSGDVSHVAVLVAKGTTAPAVSTAPADDLYDPAASGTTVTGLAGNATYTVSVIVYDALDQPSDAVTTTLFGTTLATAAPSVTYGGATTTTATMTTAGTTTRLAGRALRLYQRRHGTTAWALVGTYATGATGVASVRQVPTVNTDYRWSFPGSATELGAEGPVRVVGVAPRVAASLSAGTIALKRSAALTVSVAPSHRGQRVWLQRLSGRTWVNVTSTLLSTASTARFTIVGAARGTVSYRAYKPADGDHTAAYSPVRALRVT